MTEQEDLRADIQPTRDADIARGGKTISEFMADQELAGGVSLDPDMDAAPVSLLAADPGRRYDKGKFITRGGMGAILSTRDLNIRRTVAMKIVLEGKNAPRENLLRFIEEAQVTGQLEHPNIVPVHELGVDAQDNLFYTMKLVHGRTLKQISDDIRAGDAGTIRRHSLPAQLLSFLKICDAVAFAHSRGVVHRDLKPENVMLGEYGEVLVMDWGLAKVLQEQGARTPQPAVTGPATTGSAAARSTAPAAGALIDSLRFREEGAGLRTMDGIALGTPSFMAPEQAAGNTAAIDARTDIYALGGILYSILTLHPPVEGRTVEALLLKVVRGEIQPPTAYNPSSSRTPGKVSATPAPAAAAAPAGTPLPHCPDGRIPAALSAVAMKALALDPGSRYQTVQELQADIEAYQAGFATSAEAAGLWRQLRLLVRRHRREFGLAAAAAVVIVALVAGFVIRLGAETKRAVAGEQQAMVNERKAITARNETEAALQREQMENYRNTIALADRKIADGEIVQAKELLWATPKALRGWEWGRCIYLCEMDLATIDPEREGVSCLEFSADGTRLLVMAGGYGNLTMVWDVTTGRESLRLEGPAPARCAAFSPDGGRIVTGHQDGTAAVWDASTGRKVLTLPGHKPWVTGVAFSPDGTRIATAEGDGDETERENVRAFLWDATTGARLAVFEGHRKTVWSVKVSPDGKRVVTGSADGTVWLWDARSGRQQRVIDLGSGRVYSVAFSPDGARVVAGGSSPASAGVWDAATGERLMTLSGHRSAVWWVGVSRDGRIVTASDDRTARIWDAATGQLRRSINAKTPLLSAALRGDGKLLATAGAQGIYFWDTGEDRGTVMFPGGMGKLATLPGGNGTQILTGVYGGRVGRWDADTGRTLTATAFPDGSPCTLATTADGSRLAVWRCDGNTALWDARTGVKIADLAGHTAPVMSIAFSPDGTRVASCAGRPLNTGTQNTVFVSDASTGRPLFRILGHDRMVWSVSFSADGRRLVTGGHDGTARIWDAANGRQLRVLQSSTGYGASFAGSFSPDGHRVVTGHWSNVVLIWDADTGRELCKLHGHSSPLVAALFSPDGRRVFTTSRDGSLRVWEAEKGHELLVAEVGMPGKGSDNLSISTDGRLVAVNTVPGTAVLPAVDWTWEREDVGKWKRERYRRWLAENRALAER